VVLVGSTGYLRGNGAALEGILKIDAAQSIAHANQWLSFSARDASFQPYVTGMRDADVATEFAMRGPYTFGGTKSISGNETRAIVGNEPTSQGTRIPIVLYVDANGAPRPVEEVTNPSARSSSVEGEVTFSKWGERVNPRAPTASVPLASLDPAG
jgi:hypothetical protein